MSTTPILLVHGIDDTGIRFERLRSFLLAKGFVTVQAMDILPPDGSISIERMAFQVQEATQALQRATNAEKIDIVAYSMGALATRYFIQRQGGRSMVQRFISLAAPHHGTYMAHFRGGAGCRQMRPGSSLLRDLNGDPDPWGDVAVHSFWSPLDLMIVPASSSQLSQADNRTFAVLIHPWIASDPRVIECITQTLAED